MNTERLNQVAKAILRDFQSTNSESLLEQLVTQLTNQINQPNQPQHQQNFSNILKSLQQKLLEAESNDFPPTWNQVIEEFGYEDVLGTKVKEKIDEIFSRNQITPATALEEIQAIKNQVTKLRAALTQITTGFNQLNIGANELEPGQCEIGILIPRKFVKNKLESFGKEIAQLNKIFNIFAEITMGNRPGFEIREISSSELTVFLDSLPETAACIAVALERLVAFYEKLLNIKIKHADLKKLEVPDENLKGLKTHSNNIMKEGIETIIPELMEKFYKEVKKDSGRKNELEIELKICLKNLATRIDNGFNIEIRSEPPIEEKSDEGNEGSDERQRLLETFDTIHSASKSLTFLKQRGNQF